MNQSVLQKICLHCGSHCDSDVIDDGNVSFCCIGCKSVYDILNKNHLCDYYSIQSHPGLRQKNAIPSKRFEFLDKLDFKTKIIEFKNGEEEHVRFYLPQIHCSSCLWLLERLSHINSAILESRIHFFNKEIYIVYNSSKISLREVVELLVSVGYEPHLNLESTTSKDNVFDRSFGLNIGIAGFCFGNIMLMSIADYLSYGSMDHNIYRFFSYISLALSLPALYSASVFFEAAWKGIKHKILTIDLPVVIAILITFSRSLYEIMNQQGMGYLDSMSGIIFFMLISKWVQSRTYRKIFFDKDYKSFFPAYANRVIGNRSEFVELKQLKINDVILVHSYEVIPVDGILSKGNAIIDYSFVNGESEPVKVNTGGLLYAGGRQTGSNIEVVVRKEFEKSKLISLWNNSAFKQKTAVVQNEYDRIANIFTFLIVGLGIGAGLYWMNLREYERMWNAVITVLIVACPCALLLSKNFTYGNIMRILSYNGLFLRDSELITKFKDVKSIVFDKTGTLTESEHQKVVYHGKTLSKEFKLILSSLFHQSSHPMSQVIKRFLNLPANLVLENYKEHPGQGIEAWIDEQYIKLGSADFLKVKSHGGLGSEIHVECDSEYLGCFRLQNTFRFGLKEMFSNLESRYNLTLLSGDNDSDSSKVREFMGETAELKFRQTPQEKLDYIKTIQANGLQVLTIGDGLNDAGAFKQSELSICVADESKSFTPACDAILEGRSVRSLHQLIHFIVSGNNLVKLSFALSIVYNIIGLYYSLQGVLTPLIAAILMPLSSITIISMSYLLSQYLAYRIKLKTSV